MKTNTKIFLTLSVLFLGFNALAEISELPVPREFDRLYSINSKGEIQPRYGSVKTPDSIKVDVIDSGLRVFNTAKDTTAWYVGSAPCSQNKELKCVSIYNRKSSQSTGNQQSFLDKNRKDESDFTLIQMNPKKSEDNSVVKCSSQFVTGALRDKADLSGCVKLSKSTCENWSQVLSSDKNRSLFAALAKKGEECSQMLNDASELRRSMKSIFQDEIKNSEKEISRNFDEATRENGGLRIVSKVEIKQAAELSPNITVYKDLFDRIDDCNSYSQVFVSDATRAKERLNSVLDQAPAKTKKTNSSKAGTRQ